MRGCFGLRALTALAAVLMRISAAPGRLGAWIVFLLVLIVLFSVVGAQMSWSHLVSWDAHLPLFGEQLTMVGIAEFQWHLFALLIMLSGAYTLREEQHIRVDVISSHLSLRARTVIDLCGDIFLLLPFFGLLFWFSLDFVEMAYRFGEQSNSGGLVDRYLVKSVLPLGSGLLLVCGLGRILGNVAKLIDLSSKAFSSCTDSHNNTNKHQELFVKSVEREQKR